VPAAPSSTRSAVLVPGCGRNSRNINLQYVAPEPVFSAEPLLFDRIFASDDEYDGDIRTPLAGSEESGAADRTVMNAVPPFAGNLKLPVNTAPAASATVSPGCAAFNAAWRSPPLGTLIVAARAVIVPAANIKHTPKAIRVIFIS
jgi:hypothetical protein